MKINNLQIHLNYHSLEKYSFVPWNNRRIAAAKRSIKKEREKAGLFGEELMRFTTVEERIEMMESNTKAFLLRMRNGDAQELREIKKRFNSFDNETQEEIINYWDSLGDRYPRKPTFLLGLMHNLIIDPLHIKRIIGKAHPYTQTIIEGYGKIKIIEISKEKYEEMFQVK